MLVVERLDAKVETRDLPLGRWTVARWSPPQSSPLCGVVDNVWYFDGTLSQAKERVFPDGRTELIVMSTNRTVTAIASTLPPFRRSALTGFARVRRW